MNPIADLRRIYDRLDARISLKVSRPDVHVSCKKGCDACCYQLVRIPVVEGVALARWLRAHREDLARFCSHLPLRLEHLAHVRAHSEHYHFAHLPCLLLSPERTCRVYEMRPAVCRSHYVVSDPMYCAGAGDIEVVNVQGELQDAATDEVSLSEQANLPPGPVALPVAIAWGLLILSYGVNGWIERMSDREPDDPLSFSFWERPVDVRPPR